MAKSTVKFSRAIPHPSTKGVQDVTPEELKDQISEVHLIDVRRPDEFTGELGHIAGSKLIVLDTLPAHASDLPKDGTIVFVCRSGARSAQAAAFAQAQGLKSVYNMGGGMLRWNQLGFPIEK